jgi:hypothetical protein
MTKVDFCNDQFWFCGGIFLCEMSLVGWHLVSCLHDTFSDLKIGTTLFPIVVYFLSLLSVFHKI